MQELEMCFQLIVICERCLGGRPQQRIVVWEGGEEHAKEEARGYEWSSLLKSWFMVRTYGQ